MRLFITLITILLGLAAQLDAQEIVGDNYVCPAEQSSYRITGLAPGQSGTWSIEPTNAGIIASSTIDFVRINWTTSIAAPITLTYTAGADTYSTEIEIESTLSLVCNKQVNISLTDECEAVVLPNTLLKNMKYDDGSFTVSLKDVTTGQTIQGNTLGKSHVGHEIEATVVQDCSRNRCWSTIIPEDKSQYGMTCRKITVDCDAAKGPMELSMIPMEGVPKLVDEGHFLISGKHCAEVDLYFQDSINLKDCDETYAQKLYRKWKWPKSAFENKICFDTILVKRPDIDEIVFPDHITENSALECSYAGKENGWIVLPNGLPSPETTGRPTGNICGNVNIDYHDFTLPICGSKAVKLKRTWKVADWCSGEVVEHDQFINIEDRSLPICESPEPFYVENMDGTCLSSFKIKSPKAYDECSQVSISMSYKDKIVGQSPFVNTHTKGVTGPDQNGLFTVEDPQITRDSIYVIYTVVDDCNNRTQCYTTAKIKDTEAPSVICDNSTTIGIGELGYTWADYRAFDDGSWDNCGIDKYELRKLGPDHCSDTEQEWFTRLKFCCADINGGVDIEMKVTDVHGNYNYCKSKVWIQDNTAPKVEYCPEDQTIECDSTILDYSSFGTPRFSDFCNFTVRDTLIRRINSCGVGSVERLFIAEDDYGNKSECKQTIWIERNRILKQEDITFPANITIEGCTIDSNSMDYGHPIISNDVCSDVKYNHKDSRFIADNDGSCFKILREWTVIDWCTYDESNQDQGIFYHTQVIKVLDNVDPVFENCPSTVVPSGLVAIGECSFLVPRLQIGATDDCDEELSYSFDLDLNADGSLDLSAKQSELLNQVFGHGEHTIVWKASDNCGNTARCQQTIVVQDNKAPTPYCHPSVSTTLDKETGTVEIWASDFLLNKEDNCDEDDLYVSFADDTLHQARTFTCGDISDDQDFATIAVDIYLIDSDGNSDFCRSELSLKSVDKCSESDNGMAEIHGEVGTFMDRPILDGIIQFVNTDGVVKKTPIQQDGNYGIYDLPQNQFYQLDIIKDTKANDGLSALDILVTQRFLLGLSDFTSPYQAIAADVNGSDNISTIDLVLIRQVILGLRDGFSNGEDWIYLNSKDEFADDQDPFPYNEKIVLNIENQDYLDLDIVAVKRGDVNGSYNEKHLKSRTQTMRKTYLSSSESVARIKMELGSKERVFGGQLALDVGQHASVDQVKIGNETLDPQEYVLDQGNLKIVWTDVNGTSANDYLTLTIGGKNLEIEQSNPIEDFESGMIISANSIDFDFVALDMEREAKSTQMIKLTPNPFYNAIQLELEQDESAMVYFRLYDMHGILVHKENKYLDRGVNQLEINGLSGTPAGVYFLEIVDAHQRVFRKLIKAR